MNITKHLDKLINECTALEMSYQKFSMVYPKPNLEAVNHICTECGELNRTYHSPAPTLYSKTTDFYYFTCSCGHSETINVWGSDQ